MSLHWGGAAAAGLYSGYGGAMGPGGYGVYSHRNCPHASGRSAFSQPAWYTRLRDWAERYNIPHHAPNYPWTVAGVDGYGNIHLYHRGDSSSTVDGVHGGSSSSGTGSNYMRSYYGGSAYSLPNTDDSFRGYGRRYQRPHHHHQRRQGRYFRYI